MLALSDWIWRRMSFRRMGRMRLAPSCSELCGKLGDGVKKGVGDQTTRIRKKERYAMNENSVVSLRQKDEIDDPLTEILRTGARRLITRAVEVEFDTFLASNGVVQK